MDATGKITKIEPHFSGIYAEIQFNEQIGERLEELAKSEKLSIEIKPYRKQRSLDANSYFHVLVNLMADNQHISTYEMKNHLICSYGQFYYQDDKIPTFESKAENWDNKDGHSGMYVFMLEQGLHPRLIQSDDPEHVKFALMRGSHTYNTKEMATLIDGTVQEAKEMGIDTYTPEQIREMKERWGV